MLTLFCRISGGIEFLKICPKTKYHHSSKCKAENSGDIVKGLKVLPLKYTQNLIIAHINTNSIRHKFDLLLNLVASNIDFIMISKTKIDEPFPISQSLIEGFPSSSHLDRNEHGGGFKYILKITLRLNY